MATPPPGADAPARPRQRLGYFGPPAYPLPPRWGFPPIAWRWQNPVPVVERVDPVVRVRALAKPAVLVLGVYAVLAVAAGLAEGWRYVVLLRSRTGALSSSLVSTSDSLVVTAGLLAVVGAGLAAVMTLWWLSVARRAASDGTGHAQARPDWQVLPALFVPGVNLVLPGSMLAELEHAALLRPASARPRPSRLLIFWWVAWVVGGLLFAATVLWRLRAGVQAQADAIVLSFATDVVAAVVAVLTALVVRRITALLAPARVKVFAHRQVVSVGEVSGPPQRVARSSAAAR